MKRIVTLLVMLQLGLLAGLAQIVEPEIAWRQAYQGTLSSNGVPVNGPHDIIMRLYDAPSGGVQIGASVTNTSVPVTNGLFTAFLSPAPWSSDDFSYADPYVQIALRRSGSGQPYVTLLPRQRLASVPRATVAERALTISSNALSPTYLGTNGVDGAILAPGSVDGNKIAAASVVKSINGLKDGVILQAADDLVLTTVGNTMTLKSLGNCEKYTNCYWSLFGNGNIVAGVNFMGGILGELDPVEFRVNNTHVMRYEVAGYAGSPSTPNIIGGSLDNDITTGRGSVIGGGGYTGQPNFMENGHWNVIAGGVANRMTNQYGVIGGGLQNHIHGSANPSAGWYSIIGGGFNNKITAGTGATLSGGSSSVIGADYATIGGGAFNTNSGSSSTIGGGDHNVIPSGATITTVAGGRNNVASGDQSVIGGGQNNRTTPTGSAAVVGGGFNNEAGADTSTIGGGVANVITAVAANAMIGGGANNYDSAIAATIGGGIYNTNAGISSTIAGGEYNVIPAGADRSTVAGGHHNVASGPTATVSGGSFNTAVAPNSTIPGGLQALTRSYGQQAYANGQFANPGDAQASLYVLRTNTSGNNVIAELFLDGGTANQRMIVPDGATWTFNIMVVARSTTGASAMWEFKGMVETVGTITTVRYATPTQTFIEGSATGWTASVPTGGALVINVNSGTANNANVRWVASVRTTEVTNP